MKIFKRVLEWAKGKLGAKKEAAFDWDLNLPTKEEVEEGQRRIVRKKKRGRAHAVSAKLAELAVIAASMLTCEMVYKGLNYELARSLGATLENSLMALSVAITLSMCIYIGFLKASKLSTTMDRTSAFIGGWVCIFLFCCWAVGTSSWYAFMSTTGIPALEMHLNAATDKLEKAVASATAQIKNARGIPTAMSAKAAGFSARGTSEASGGGATGARGAGPLSQSLEGAAAVLNTGSEEIRGAIEKADAEAVKMRAKLSEISVAVNNRDLKMSEREGVFVKGASELRSMIGAMNSAGLGEMVRSSLAAVESAVSAMPTDGSKVGARQTAAIDQTRQDMAEIAAKLTTLIDELSGAEAVSGSLVESVSMSEVVWEFKHKFKPALALAIGIDLFAVWALIFLGLHGLEEVKRREKREARVRGLLELDDVVGKELLNPDVLAKIALPAAEKVAVAPAGKKRERA
jgi:hypothetical protein